MEVSSANKPPIQPAKPAKPVNPVQQAQQQHQAAKAKAPETTKAAETKPRPMVNSQGQTTSRVLHATA